jgi:hypothetical protein
VNFSLEWNAQFIFGARIRVLKSTSYLLYYLLIVQHATILQLQDNTTLNTSEDSISNDLLNTLQPAQPQTEPSPAFPNESSQTQPPSIIRDLLSSRSSLVADTEDRPMTSYPTKSSNDGSPPTNYPQSVSSRSNNYQSRIPTYSPSFSGGYNTKPNQWEGSTPYTSSYTPSYASPYAPQYGDSRNNQYGSPYGSYRGNQQPTPSGYNNGPSNSNSGNYNQAIPHSPDQQPISSGPSSEYSNRPGYTGGYNQQSIPYASSPYNADSYDSNPIPYGSIPYNQDYGSVPYNQGGYGQQPISYGPSEYNSGSIVFVFNALTYDFLTLISFFRL